MVQTAFEIMISIQPSVSQRFTCLKMNCSTRPMRASCKIMRVNEISIWRVSGRRKCRKMA